MLRRVLLIPMCVLAACGDDGGSSGPDAGSVDAEVPDAETPPDAGPECPAIDPEPDPTLDPPAEVVQCTTPLPAPTEGSCDVVDGAGTAVVVRGNVLADGTTYLDGSVMYDGDRIVCVGCDCSAEAGFAEATVITCAGAAVSPGLVNAHSHLSWDESYPLAPSTTRYQHRHDWRGSVTTPNNPHGTAADSVGMRWAELRHLMNGTTSIAASTRALGLVRNVDGLEGRDFAVGFPDSTTYETFALGDGNETFHADCTWNYKFSDFQVSLMHGLVTHTAEGINSYAAEEFRCQSRSTDGGEDFVEGNVGHIHGIGLTAADYYNMVRDEAKLVWSPRSNISLYGNTAQPQVFARLGGDVALGTDWALSGSASLVREMVCAQSLDDAYLGDVFTDEDIWRMATLHGARATKMDALIGSLADGKLADLAVFRAEPGQTHGAILAATTDDVLLVVRDGDVMSGEADVVAALDPSCEEVDVCGAARRVCATREVGVTYASLETAVGSTGYPTELCDPVPPMEPTCVPTRPGEYTGPTLEDPDGDGVTTGDNCPDVFNPIRPMDGGAQPDVDGDGTGDACDATPVGTDLDGDGTGNATDRCPFVGDDQADADCDGQGDLCDGCPDAPNPDGVCAPPATTIVAIQDGTVASGSDVYVTGAVVTGVGSDGFAMQDPTVASGQYAGVWVYTGGAPGVAIGDVVTVAGTTTEYFMLTEITGQVLSKTAGTPLDPVALTVAEAAMEPYEGTLVTLTDVTLVDIPFDCSVDSPSCADPRLWELNDAIVAWDKVWQDGIATWDAEGAALDATPGPVSGVMFYRHNRRRILPRVAADVGN